jgi:hypothetical protein
MTVSQERWRDLCKQAAVEKDPQKLRQICDEIASILQRASNASEQASLCEKLIAADHRPA